MTGADGHAVWSYLTTLVSVHHFSCDTEVTSATEPEVFAVTLSMREGFSFADAEAAIRAQFPTLADAGLLKITEGARP